ncbi:MAG: MarR family transcriptional regulator [Halobacteriota archaeon]
MERENIHRKTVFVAAVFVAAVFILGIKLLNPTPIQIIVAGNEVAVKTIPGFFTYTDVVILVIAILESDGIIEQSELVEKTGLPKSNVSRSLDLLESKGLAERRRRGTGNVVLLK